MKEPTDRTWIFLWRHLLLVACAVVALNGASAQTSRPASGSLLSPHRKTILAAGCKVSQMQLRIRTGNDDLRGGGNNLNVEIHFADGTTQFANNVNKNANWGNNSINTVQIPLTKPAAPSEVKQIRLIHLAQGGYTPPQGAGVGTLGTVAAPIMLANGVKSEDNWDMAQFQASGLGNGFSSIPIASFGAHRFTGSEPSLDINTLPNAMCPSSGQVTALEFSFNTGNDDLRGGKDNLNIVLNFADGTSQAELNANQSQSWKDGSNHQLSVVLNRPVTLDQIRSITLETTFTGGKWWRQLEHELSGDLCVCERENHSPGDFGLSSL
jgi:hypothetical protein